MNQAGFEGRVLHLWTTTRIPLTKVHLQVLTGAPRSKLDGWLDALVKGGVLELDSDADGNLLYKVVGAERPTGGITTVAEWQKMEELKGSVAHARPTHGRQTAVATVPAGSDEKSILASGALSFVLGPFGWLYAAPLVDAVGGIALYLLLNALLPTFLFFWLLGITQPLSALMGMLYAWQYNKKGTRTSIKDMGKEEDRPRLLK